ncbi:ethanolamine ammonia-lyase subunit EutC [Mycolicibacterium thermoresistibile]
MTAPEDIAPDDGWAALRRLTGARIGLGRAGTAVSTRHVLELKAAHSAARDAVHDPLDVELLAEQVGALGIGEPVRIRSRATSRGEYLRRPDLGRVPQDLSALVDTGPDIALVLADGLSPRAITQHGAGLTAALIAELEGRYRIAPPVIATGARVAIGDHIGQRLGAQNVLVLIGERPGLSVANSVGIYLTHLPRPGRTDAERNCISNIHPPTGMDHRTAARIAGALIDGARRLGASGVALKDTSADGPAAGGGPTIEGVER